MRHQKQTPKITVAIRKRPLSKKELQRNQTDIIRIDNQRTVITSEYKQKVDLTKYIEETTFNFDYAFDEKCDNLRIYEACIQPLIDSAFMGAKVSCFAYGQTGSGKTFTMKGDLQKGVPGLYYLAAQQIFQYLSHPNFQHLAVNVSFFEIYCGKLFDLFNNRNELKIREDKKNNINVIGIQEKSISSANQFLDLIQYGSTFRVTSQNATNADSSRSHAILQIQLKEGKKNFSKLSFIDLAGNERGADHMDQNKQTKIDGAEINKSLLALKECIRALDQGKSHTPFRGSKLTMVLKDSFVGFCKTVMIGNVSPNSSSSENTMNTLRYADRVKQLKNGNETPISREQQLAREMMLPRTNKNNIKVTISKNDDQQDIEMKKQAARKEQKKVIERPQWNNEMDIEPQEPPRRRTDVYQPEHFNQKPGSQRRSMVPKLSQQIEPQDQNNPRQRHMNFPVKSTKDIKSNLINEPKPRNLQVEMGDNQKKNNRNYFPRIESQNMGYQQNNVHRSQMEYHQLMQDIDQMKTQFLSDHFNLIKQEGIMLKEEGMLFEKISRTPRFDIKSYIQNIQHTINRKLEILNSLQSKADYLADRVNEAENMGNFLGDNQMNDEQLLEGLPCDDFGGRLF